MSDWNMPAGSEWILAGQERAADEYEYALDRAWEYFADNGDVPMGVGWEPDEGEYGDGVIVFVFRDAGGVEGSYEVSMLVGLYDDDDDGPPSWWD